MNDPATGSVNETIRCRGLVGFIVVVPDAGCRL